MKLKLILILVIISVSCLLVQRCNAQVVTSSSFDKDNYYQGDVGKITITLLNNQSEFTIVTSICYLQFDWQNSGDYFDSYTISDIPFESSYTFTIIFNIPQNVAAGNHAYKIVWVDKDFFYRNITVKSGILEIRELYERKYYLVFNDVIKIYSQVHPIGETANLLFKQAENSLFLADYLSKQGYWEEAVTKLNDARGLLDQANISSQGTINLYKMIIIAIIVISIIMLGVLLYLRNSAHSYEKRLRPPDVHVSIVPIRQKRAQ